MPARLLPARRGAQPSWALLEPLGKESKARLELLAQQGLHSVPSTLRSLPPLRRWQRASWRPGRGRRWASCRAGSRPEQPLRRWLLLLQFLQPRRAHAGRGRGRWLELVRLVTQARHATSKEQIMQVAALSIFVNTVIIGSRRRRVELSQQSAVLL